MVSVRLSQAFVALALAATSLTSVVAAPLSRAANNAVANLQARDNSQAAPHFVVYSDAWVSGQVTLPDPAEIKGFNVFVLSFLLSKSSADQAIFWEQLSEADRKAALDKYHAAGIKVIVSAFGATEMPTSQGFDAVETANRMADWVIKYGIDGIDVDYEDLDAMNKMDGAAEKWLSDYTTALRAKLPKGQYIVTHAPLAPWFSAAHYSTGAYATVHKNVGDQIDWYNMQFYNQGASEYVDCKGLFTESSSQWPDTAVFQIADKAGVPKDKIVVGKPAGPGDANNGFMDASTLAGCMAEAKGKGWNAGAMVWQFPHAKSAWAMGVRGSAFPLEGGGGDVPPPPPAGTTTAPAPGQTTQTPPPPPPGGDNCGSQKPWDAGSVYTGGATVSYNGKTYTAKWWTQGEKPGSADVWAESNPCGKRVVPAPVRRADCSGAKAWDAGSVYTGGLTVSYNGKTYTAKWWTQGEKPGSSDVWAEASCGGSTAPATTAAPATSAPATSAPATSAPAPTTQAPPPTQTGGSTGNGNGGASLKKHALIGYLHSSFANGAGYIPMKEVSDDWDVINLSFGEPDSVTSGNIQYHMCPKTECPNVESEEDFVAAVKEKVSKGKLVQLSIGGEKGQVRLETEAARDKFVESVSAIMDKYALTGIDIDFEGQSMHLDAGDTDFENPKTAVVVNLIAALKSLKAKYGDKFSLTMAPETFFVQLAATFYGSGDFGGQDPRAGSFIPVIHALRDELTILHVQDYNSGPINDLAGTAQNMGSSDFHVAMTDILLNGFAVAGKKDKMFPALRPDQVGFGVPSSTGAGNGYIDPTQIQAAFDCLTKGANCGSYKPKASYPDLRGVMTWSINWDHFNGDTFAKAMRPYLDGQ